MGRLPLRMRLKMNRHSGDHEQRAQWDAVVTALRRGQRIAITSHIDPDPDSIGSCLAVWHGLLSLDKQPVVVMADEVPHYLRFLSGADEILTLGRGQKNLLGDDRRFDTLVVVDCEPERTGGILPEELGDIVVVNIDHHVSNEAQVDHKVLVPQAAATAELIGQLLAQLQVPLTGESAQCLLAGLIGDTGSAYVTPPLRPIALLPNCWRLAPTAKKFINNSLKPFLLSFPGCCVASCSDCIAPMMGGWPGSKFPWNWSPR